MLSLAGGGKTPNGQSKRRVAMMDDSHSYKALLQSVQRIMSVNECLEENQLHCALPNMRTWMPPIHERTNKGVDCYEWQPLFFIAPLPLLRYRLDC